MAYAKDGRTVQSKKPNTSLDTVLHQRLEKINNYNLLHEDKEPAKVLPKNTIHKAKKLVKPFEMRALPVIVLVACLLLVIKVPNIYHTVEIILSDTRVVALAEAQETSVSKSSTTKSISSKKMNKTKVEEDLNTEKPLDPVLFTRSEIELLQELSKRRKELDGRERAIVQREGLLMATESRLEVKINELELIKTDIETLITKYNAQEEEKFKGLVAIYEKMKPKDSARIFDELDIEILLEVFERMKSSKSASILAKMMPARAKEITSRIADRREMPELGLKK
jgi:flagellar motility protein MotE (MotC chaperone)